MSCLQALRYSYLNVYWRADRVEAFLTIDSVTGCQRFTDVEI